MEKKLDLTAISSQEEALVKAIEEAAKAVEAYNQDLQIRLGNLNSQAIHIQQELNALSEEKKKLSMRATDAVSRGNLDDAAAADEALEKLDKRITVLERKKRLASSAELKGDQSLYEAARIAFEKARKLGKTYDEAMEELASNISKEIERLRAVKKGLAYNGSVYKIRYIESDFRKVERHYLELDRKEAEAKRLCEEQQKAKGPKRNVQICVPSD